MRIWIRMACYLAAVSAVAILGSGCASMNLSKDLTFTPREPSIARGISLYASREAQSFVLEGSKMGRTYRIPVGEALLPNAQSCLALAFEHVDIAESLTSSKAPFTVDLDFPEKGHIDIGLTSFSASPVTLSLRARVHCGDGTVIWEKTVQTTASAKSRWQIAAIIPIFGALGHDRAIVLAAEKSLQQSLDEIRDALLNNKDIFMKEKAK